MEAAAAKKAAEQVATAEAVVAKESQEAEQAAADADKEKKEAKQMGKIRTTKAAEGHAKKLMEPEDTGHKEPFKLSKFKHVKSKMGSLPGTRKPTSQVTASGRRLSALGK